MFAYNGDAGIVVVAVVVVVVIIIITAAIVLTAPVVNSGFDVASAVLIVALVVDC